VRRKCRRGRGPGERPGAGRSIVQKRSGRGKRIGSRRQSPIKSTGKDSVLKQKRWDKAKIRKPEGCGTRARGKTGMAEENQKTSACMADISKNNPRTVVVESTVCLPHRTIFYAFQEVNILHRGLRGALDPRDIKWSSMQRESRPRYILNTGNLELRSSLAQRTDRKRDGSPSTDRKRNEPGEKSQANTARPKRGTKGGGKLHYSYVPKEKVRMEIPRRSGNPSNPAARVRKYYVFRPFSKPGATR